MLLKGEQLAAHLERELRPLYVLYGDEPLLVLEAADAIRARARQQGYSEREVLTVLPQFDWGQLMAAGGNMSLFGDKKLIDLRIPTGKPGKEGSAALQQWCQNLSADNLLLITLPELDWREEKAVWFTALVNAGVALKLNAPPLAELPGWIAGRLRRQQQSADLESLKFVAERVEGNLLAAHQEIQKLALLYPAGQLSMAQAARQAHLATAGGHQWPGDGEIHGICLGSFRAHGSPGSDPWLFQRHQRLPVCPGPPRPGGSCPAAGPGLPDGEGAPSLR